MCHWSNEEVENFFKSYDWPMEMGTLSHGPEETLLLPIGLLFNYVILLNEHVVSPLLPPAQVIYLLKIAGSDIGHFSYKPTAILVTYRHQQLLHSRVKHG